MCRRSRREPPADPHIGEEKAPDPRVLPCRSRGKETGGRQKLPVRYAILNLPRSRLRMPRKLTDHGDDFAVPKCEARVAVPKVLRPHVRKALPQQEHPLPRQEFMGQRYPTEVTNSVVLARRHNASFDPIVA